MLKEIFRNIDKWIYAIISPAIIYSILQISLNWHLVQHGEIIVQLNEVIENLSLAIISSFIFFVIVNEYPRANERRNLKSFFMRKLNRIISSYDEMLNNIEIEAIKINPNLKDAELESQLEVINPRNEAPLILGVRRANWLELIALNRTNCIQDIDQLFRLNRYLSSEIIELLTNIESSTHFSVIGILPVKIQNNNLSVFAKGIEKHGRLINDLKVRAVKERIL